MLAKSGLVAWRSSNASDQINEVTRRRRVSALMSDYLQAGKPSLYVTSRLGQLSLPSLRGT